jgi:hypothetical protein
MCITCGYTASLRNHRDRAYPTLNRQVPSGRPVNVHVTVRHPQPLPCGSLRTLRTGSDPKGFVP